ncbi:MAG: hypothetical protein LQ348_006803 [Seirophora lacunosa]|nr:MAG: hypothetical protein LQ348_006803 [Seirophora lacunosa]
MSLRDKIGRIWGRSNGDSPNTSTDLSPSRLGHQKLLSENDAHRPTVTHEPSLSPRKLHKAASTTFQLFSNSIRSRAQAFYVNPSQVEADASATPEPKTPKRSPRRSALWSSVRNRKSRSDCEEKPTPDDESETLPEEKLSPIGPAPRLDLQFPASTLGDYQDEDDVTTPSVTPDRSATRCLTPFPASAGSLRPRQLWPSPQMQLRNLSTAREGLPIKTIMESNDREQPFVAGKDPSATEAPLGTTDQVQPRHTREAPPANDTPTDLDSVEKSPALEHDEPIQGIEAAALQLPDSVTIGATDSNHGAVKGLRMRSNAISENAGYISDTESNAETLATKASTARTSMSRPSSFAKRLRESSLSFDNAFQSKEDFRGTFWPAAKVIKSSKRSSRSSTGNGSTALATEFPPDKEDSATDPPLEFLDFDDGEAPSISRVSSGSYEADNEEAVSSPPDVSMGPRAVWEESRARRNKRYAALDMDSSTDEDSNFGFELKAESTHMFVRGSSDDRTHLLRESDAIPNKSSEENNPWVSKFLSKGQPVDTLLAIDFLRASTHQDPDMSKSARTEHPVSASSKALTAPIIPIDEYQSDKGLRHRLLTGKNDFALGETSSGQDVSTPEDRFFIISELDASDSFEAKLAQFGHVGGRPYQDSDRAAMDARSKLDSPRSDVATDSIVPLPGSASENDLASRTSELSLSERPAAKSSVPSRLFERGRSGMVAFRRPSQRRSARALGKITPVKRCASASSTATSSDSSASRASSCSFDRVGSKQEPRLRLADISMVKRREALLERAMYNGLCRFVYKCEDESEAEVSSEVPEDEEGGAGYSASTFKGK